VNNHIIFIFNFQKDITGKNTRGGGNNLPLSADIDFSLGKIKGNPDFRMQGLEKFDVFFLTPCFYLYRKINHPPKNTIKTGPFLYF
jgi:hypothetical protein